MTFPNPTRLRKMSVQELRAEFDLRFAEGLWSGRDGGAAVRERIDAVSREMNRRRINVTS